MKIRNGLPVREVGRKVYKREAAKKQRPDQLEIAQTYIARVMKEYTTRASYADDYEVYVNHVQPPKRRRAPWRWFSSSTSVVELIPIGGVYGQASDMEDPISKQSLSPDGNILEYKVNMGGVVPRKYVIGYLLAKDFRNKEQPAATHDPSVTPLDIYV